MNPFDELLKSHEATRKEIDELEANVEKCNIDRMLLKYDSDKIVQDLRFTEAFLRDTYRDEDGKELLRKAKFKADIFSDANIYMSGFRKERSSRPLTVKIRRRFSSIVSRNVGLYLKCCCADQCPRPEGPSLCHPSA